MFLRSDKITAKTYQAGLLQAKAYRALTNFMSCELAAFDLSLPDWAMLGLMTENHHIRPSELAHELGVKPPVVTANLKRLESAGLVERRVHDSDSRVYEVSLTVAGRKRVDSVEASLRETMGGFLKGIKNSELINYLNVLNKLAGKL